jgi:hypothetical protein
MINRLSRLLISLGLMLLVFYLNPAIALAQPDPAELSKAVQEIEFLDGMRSGLASTLEGKSEEPTLQTMKEVCRPVGTRVMELSRLVRESTVQTMSGLAHKRTHTRLNGRMRVGDSCC